MKSAPGIGLVEIIVATATAIFIVSAYGAIISNFQLGRQNTRQAQAYQLAQSQIEILKTVPLANLTPQTDGPPRFWAENLGSIRVKTSGQAYDGSQVLEVSGSAVEGSSFSGVAVIPTERYFDFNFSTRLKIPVNPPSNWRVGQVFRYQDNLNYYYLYLNENGLKLEKRVQGASSELYSRNLQINFETWYHLRINAAGDRLQIYLNDNLLNTITDSTIGFGWLGLASKANAIGIFDAVSVNTAASQFWNFENDIDGQTPKSWQRFWANTLDQRQLILTIENYLGDQMKKVTVKVHWHDPGSRQISLTSILGND